MGKSKKICLTCQQGFLKRRDDDLFECDVCGSCFEENGKSVDEVPLTKKQIEEIRKMKKTGKDDWDIYPVHCPS